MGCSESKTLKGDGPVLQPLSRPPASKAAIPASKDDSKRVESVTLPDQSSGIRAANKSKQPPPTKKKSDMKIDAGMFVTNKKYKSIAERYTKIAKLGDGSFGEVLLCKTKDTGAERAVKIIRKTGRESDANILKNEVEIVKKLAHPNIMKLYEFFEDRRNFYMVMECYTGGELFEEILKRSSFSEDNAALVLEQCLSAINYLHSQNVVHRDLKPENILLAQNYGEDDDAEMQIKLVDFGLSCDFEIGSGKKMTQRYGTAYYIAPEVIRKSYNEKCDVWSLGVILYILLCGYPPFAGDNDNDILASVAEGIVYFEDEEWDDISPQAKDLIKQMLRMDPKQRISASEALNHPWIRHRSSRGKINLGTASPALKNMRKFKGHQKLQTAALLYIGSQLTTMDETKHLNEAFRQMDANGDGLLDKEELIAGYRQIMKNGEDGTSVCTEEVGREVDEMLSAIDFDGNGCIDFNEFVSVAINRESLLSQDRLRAAFDLFDVDGGGFIEQAELRKLLGDNVDDATWKEILDEVDANGDGQIDFDEFTVMMKKISVT